MASYAYQVITYNGTLVMKIQNRWSDHHLNIMSAFLCIRTEQRRILGELRFSEVVALILGFLHFHNRVNGVVCVGMHEVVVRRSYFPSHLCIPCNRLRIRILEINHPLKEFQLSYLEFVWRIGAVYHVAACLRTFHSDSKSMHSTHTIAKVFLTASIQRCPFD